MNFLNKFPKYITSLQGMKKNMLAVLFGALLTGAMPPVYLWPLAIIGLSGFFLMVISSDNRSRAFKIGWWFGMGHFVTGLYWISFALLVDAASFGWLIPFALFGIPAVVAIYMGFVSLITWQVGRYVKGWRLVLVFSCVWTIIEMLRGWLFTGFPWNLAGSIWSVSDNILQFASISGVYGLSLLTALAFTMPAILLSSGQLSVDRSKIKSLLPIIFPALILFIIFMLGGNRLANAPVQFVPGVKLRIVQANIPQSMKWEDEWRYATVNKYIEMSQSKGIEDVTHIIWPETALPFVISETSPLLAVIARIAPKGGAVIAGALRAEYADSGVLRNMWNSLIVVSDEGKLFSYYDKSHLVPFGEYVPFRTILPLEKITHGSVDFASGDGPKTINAPGLPAFGGLVCYEVIFPGKVVEKDNRPEVLVNVTNDAWYGNTAGPYQHFQMARVRAVEEGVPLIRAANNGISGVVDSYGRIIDKTGLEVEAVLDAKLPTKIQSTTYGVYGNIVTILMIALLLLIVCINYIISND